MNRITFFLGFSLFIISCNNGSHSIDQQQSLSHKGNKIALENGGSLPQIGNLQLPFIGKKQFETRPAISGTGTPNRYVEIKKNGDVYFSFGQIGQDTVIEESYYAGKFQKYIKCVFKKIDEVKYYEITSKKIYEVDKNHNKLTNVDCCTVNNDTMEDKCPCEGKFFDD